MSGEAQPPNSSEFIDPEIRKILDKIAIIELELVFIGSDTPTPDMKATLSWYHNFLFDVAFSKKLPAEVKERAARIRDQISEIT